VTCECNSSRFYSWTGLIMFWWCMNKVLFSFEWNAKVSLYILKVYFQKVYDFGSALFISHSQNLNGFLCLQILMPPLKSHMNFKFMHFFSNGLVFISKLSVPKPFAIGSTTIGACDASSFSTTSAREECDVCGKWHLLHVVDLGQIVRCLLP